MGIPGEKDVRAVTKDVVALKAREVLTEGVVESRDSDSVTGIFKRVRGIPKAP